MLKVFKYRRKDDFFNKKENKYLNPILAILGFYYCDKFYDFTIQNFSINEEKKIVPFFKRVMENT